MKCLLLLAALPLIAATPNLTGTWKLVPAKSEFGNFPAPSSLTQKITHEEPSIKVVTNMATQNGDFDFESKYTTDGKETTNQFGPNDFKSTAKWEANILVINTKGQFGENEMTIKDRWELSADGKTLTLSRRFSGAQGDMDQKMVLEKQ